MLTAQILIAKPKYWILYLSIVINNDPTRI